MKMRILIITGIFPPDIGGPATYVPQMAAALTARGHTITVMTLSDEKNPLSPTEYPFQLVRLPRQAFKPWRWLLAVLTIVRLGRRADVLFVNGLALEAVLANVLLRKPLVQKIVGDLAWERATNWGWVQDSFEDFQKQCYGAKVEALKSFRAWCGRRAHRVIVPSHYLAGRVQEWGVRREKIAVIYNAVESYPSSLSMGNGSSGSPVARPGNGRRPTRLPLSTRVNVVTVGRLVPLKQTDKVLQAIARLDGVGLVVIGDGAGRRQLEELARSLDLAERVYFAGARPRAETLALMAACNLLVLNSTHEGFPHVVLEAMAVGLPVVATAVGGTPEVVENGCNGRLIPAADGEALQDALSTLTSCPQEQQRLAAGARETVARFCHSRMVEETTVLLETMKRRGTSQ